MMNNEEIGNDLADIITARPHEVRIGRKTLRLYPVTLAKTFLLRRWMEALHIDETLLKTSPCVECLRLAETRREVVAQILAIHSAPNTYRDLYDSRSTSRRRSLLLTVKTEHLAGLLMSVITDDKTGLLSEHLGLNAERERLHKVLEVKRKHSKNTLYFGGKSLFGTFICQLKELGYTDNEILYERGYSYLRLMLADNLTSIYLSDEELEELPQDAGGTLLDGEDDDALDALAAMIKTGGTKKPQND